MSTEETNETVEAGKRVKKISKRIGDDGVLTITEATTGRSLTMDINTLSDEIKLLARNHGILQKVGDAAAGSSGDEAVAAMSEVIENLKAGAWNNATHGPSGPRFSKKDIQEKMATLPADKAAELADLFKKMGITL